MGKILEHINKMILGSVTVIVTLALGFLWWMFGPDVLVPMWVVSLIIIAAYAVCVIVYAIASQKVNVTYVLPAVKGIFRSSDRLIFLVEKNDLFMQGAYVTIAFQDEDNELETTLGLGYVETVNSKGNMQIVFQKQSNEPIVSDILLRLTDTRRCRNAIKIKPTVQKFFVEEGLTQWENY